MTDIIKQFSVGSIRKPTAQDAQTLVASMRQCDIVELSKFDGSSPKAAVEASIENSKFVFSIYNNNNEFVAMTGVSWAFNPRVGRVWLLATPKLEDVSFAFAKETRNALQCFLQGHDLLSNLVYSKNLTTLRWLSWAGFEVVGEATTEHSDGDIFYEVAVFANDNVRELYVAKNWNGFSKESNFNYFDKT